MIGKREREKIGVIELCSPWITMAFVIKLFSFSNKKDFLSLRTMVSFFREKLVAWKYLVSSFSFPFFARHRRSDRMWPLRERTGVSSLQPHASALSGKKPDGGGFIKVNTCITEKNRKRPIISSVVADFKSKFPSATAQFGVTVVTAVFDSRCCHSDTCERIGPSSFEQVCSWLVN